MSGSFTFNGERQPYYTGGDPHVGEIEDIGSENGEVQVDEVGDVAVEQEAIEDIPHAAGEEEAEGDESRGFDVSGVDPADEGKGKRAK